MYVVTQSITKAWFMNEKLLWEIISQIPNLFVRRLNMITFNFWSISELQNFRFRVELYYSLTISTFKVHLTRHANKFSSFSIIANICRATSGRQSILFETITVLLVAFSTPSELDEWICPVNMLIVIAEWTLDVTKEHETVDRSIIDGFQHMIYECKLKHFFLNANHLRVLLKL